MTTSLVEQTWEFREQIRGSNTLSGDEKSAQLEFLEKVLSNASSLINTLHNSDQRPSEEQAQLANSIGKRLIDAASSEWAERLSPEVLGKTSVPISIILLCGAIGGLVTGLNPVGFGAGTILGKFLAGELKAGATTDQLIKNSNED